MSVANEARVESAGEGDVGGSLDEGAAIGKDGYGVGRALKAEQEAVHADVAEWGEAGVEGGEVDGAEVLVDLHGVAPTECDVRPANA